MWSISIEGFISIEGSSSIDGLIESPESTGLRNLREKERAQWLSPTFTSL